MNYKLAWVPFLVLILIAVLGLFFPSLPNVEPDAATLEKLSAISGSDSAWMLTAAAFVLLMTPGLAFFMEVWFPPRISFQPCCKALSVWLL